MPNDMTTKPKTRLFVSNALDQGSEVALGREHLHFLGNVLRLTSGDNVSLFNERSGEWLAKLEFRSRRQGTAQIVARLRYPQPEPGPWLAFAPVKKTRTDFIVEKATELGVARLIPVFTQYTATGRVNVDRLRAIAIEAAEQCHRLTVPDIMEATELSALLKSWPVGRMMLVGDEKGGGRSLSRIFADIDTIPECGFLIGPEGGFEENEMSRLTAVKFCQAINLGPRILRAETAAIAALSVWNALTQR